MSLENQLVDTPSFSSMDTVQKNRSVSVCIAFLFFFSRVLCEEYGPTLVAKANPSKRLVWIGVGCRVSVLSYQGLNTSLAQEDLSLVASSANLSENCSSSNVVALGLSSDGSSAMCSDSEGNLKYLTLHESENSLSFQDLPNTLLASSFRASRISNAEVSTNKGNQTQDIYIIAANAIDSASGGKAVAIATPCSDGGFCVAAEFAFEDSVNDVQVLPQLADKEGNGESNFILIASTSAGLANLTMENGEMELHGIMATSGDDDQKGNGGNDGFAISSSQTMATIAAQGVGLRVMSMSEGTEEGNAAIAGWAGDVKLDTMGAGNGTVSLALVAADPGLVSFYVDEGGDPQTWGDPMAAWSCVISGGIGWNLDLDAAACLAFLADFDGGLQVVSYCSKAAAAAAAAGAATPVDHIKPWGAATTVPRVIAHFGSGEMGTCELSRVV